PGIVDEDIDRSEQGSYVRNDFAYAAAVGHVRNIGLCLAAEIPDFTRRFCGAFGSAIDKRHGRSLARKSQGDGAPDAAGGTGHNGDLSAQAADNPSFVRSGGNHFGPVPDAVSARKSRMRRRSMSTWPRLPKTISLVISPFSSNQHS